MSECISHGTFQCKVPCRALAERDDGTPFCPLICPFFALPCPQLAQKSRDARTSLDRQRRATVNAQAPAAPRYLILFTCELFVVGGLSRCALARGSPSWASRSPARACSWAPRSRS